ncbi:centrosomal protein of 162 kDa-like isoform X2 [Haliotis rufescens]|uniref:centrosomal protein of 162 kDa-like isoform X2 n=1 Tax=Haliotis rufescens TaxID=6454 RepID=UPI00201F9DE6|nr:centrosomal protein of 162 kDa-like isoform X2 [Haliotis rufescens]
MSRRFTKEELDDQFEVFLKQSVSSDESFETLQKKSSKIAEARKKREAKPWWLDEDDQDKKLGSGLTASGKSFMKTKKSPEKKSSSEKSAKGGKTGVGKVKSKQEKTRVRKKDVSPKRPGRGRTEASMSKDSLEDISEKSEENDAGEAARIVGLDSSLDTTRDSCTADMLTDRQDSPEKVGMDTLDELADKQRFYNEVEAEGTIDYGQLNRELSQTATTLSPKLAGVAVDDSRSAAMLDHSRVSGSHGGPTERDSSQQKPSMLSKVSLLDSLDSTLNTTTSPKASVPFDGSREGNHDNLGQTFPDTLKTRTGTGMMGTNTSREMEALQEALRVVGLSPTIKQDDPLTGVLGHDSHTGSLPDPATAKQQREKERSDRTVDDIFREMGELEKRVKEKEDREDDVRLMSDYRSAHSHSSGSPNSHGKGLSHQQHMEEDQRGGFDHSHTDDTEVYQPVTAVSVKEKTDGASGTFTNVRTDEVKGKKSRSRFSHIQSSGYGKRSISRSPSHSPSRSPGKSTRPGNQTWSPADVSRHKVTGTQSPRTAHHNLQGKVPETRLLQSVESFASYIRDHFTGKGVPEVKYSSEEPSVSASLRMEKTSSVERELQQELGEERKRLASLQGEMRTLQQQHKEEMDQVKVEHEQEMFKLKQENFVLAAKLNEGEGESTARRKLGEVLSGDAVTREQLTMLEREIKDQESLIAGFQTENQRLYGEMKALRANTRSAEEKMFSENQRLITEVTNLKSQLEQKDLALRNKGIITSLAAQQQIAAGNADAQLGANKLVQLQAELTEAKRQSEIQQREMKVLQQTKQELDLHIHQLVREREDLSRDLDAAKKITPEQAKELKAQHEEEVSQLRRKLKWYAENQQLLDKGAASMKKKEEEIRQLKLRLEGLTTETGRKLEENKLRARERASDAKKIQDLQRQVKEMEQIIRRRHPNSLPALMMAAAASVGEDQAPPIKSASVTVLENRIKKLEEELASKDEASNTLLRAMEQKYNNIKYKFESRVSDLEKQLSIYQRVDGTGGDLPITHGAAMELELKELRQRYTRQVAELQAQVDRLTGELTKINKNQHNLMKNDTSRTPESDLNQQVALLQQELDEKKHDLHVLYTSLERLRKEKTGDTTKKSKTKGKGTRKKLSTPESQFDSFPPTADRSYEPQTFADSDITQVLHENQDLRTTVESLQLELDQQRVDLRKSLAETEAVARKHREDYQDQIDSLRLSHQQELQRVLSDQAFQHYSSKLAQLHSKCDSQEVMIQHLQQQLAKSEVDAEQISILKIREAAKQNQIEKLQDLLQEAKKSHSPEMRHFETLQEKIIQMENRHEQRESELKQIIANTQRVASLELDQEGEKWRKIVEVKNKEIEKFRAELDSILDVLRLLQKQGVMLPVSSIHS